MDNHDGTKKGTAPEIGETIYDDEATLIRQWRLLNDEQKAEFYERLRAQVFN